MSFYNDAVGGIIPSPMSQDLQDDFQFIWSLQEA